MSSGSSFALWRPRWGADPSRTYLALAGVSTFGYELVFTVNIVYMATVVGLDPLQLVLVGTVLETVCFLFELPTGVVADLVSRRLSILIGLVLIGLGFMVEGSMPVLPAILAAQVLWGIGTTFTSGATQAWISDEVGEEEVSAIFTRAQRVSLVAALAGTVTAGLLSLVSVQVPIVLGGACFLVLAVGLALCMPETGFRPLPRTERAGIRQGVVLAREGMRLVHHRPVVRRIVLASLLIGLSSEAVDRLWQIRIIDGFGLPHLPGADSPALYFAGISLVGIAVGLVASLSIARGRLQRLAHRHPGRLLAVWAAVEVLCLLGIAWAGSLWLALAALWGRGAVAVLAGPVRDAWLNRHLDPGVRATALSVHSQANAVGQIVGGPPLGALAARTSVPWALAASAGLLLPTVWLYLRSEGPRRVE